MGNFNLRYECGRKALMVRQWGFSEDFGRLFEGSYEGKFGFVFKVEISSLGMFGRVLLGSPMLELSTE